MSDPLFESASAGVGANPIKFTFDDHFKAQEQLLPGHADTVIVAGVGRSGTGYVAAVLGRALPLHRVGHKKVFRGGADVPCSRCLAGLDIEVSGFSPPFLSMFPYSHNPVVHVVRHPLRWLSSWRVKRYAGGYIHDVLGFRPADYSHPRFESDALKIWVLWNEMVEKRSLFRFRVEMMGRDCISAISSISRWNDMLIDERAIERALGEIPTDINSARLSPINLISPLTWNDIPDSLWRDAAQGMAEKYGYT